MNLQDKIKVWVKQQLAEMKHGSKKSLADFLDVTPTQLTKMLNTEPGKEHRVIRAEEFVKIAEFFGKTPDGLIPPLSNDDGKKQLLSIYDRVSPELQHAILAMVRALAEEKDKQ